MHATQRIMVNQTNKLIVASYLTVVKCHIQLSPLLAEDIRPLQTSPYPLLHNSIA